MKYTKGFNAKRNIAGTAFVSIIACCLLIIGGAAWFALSTYQKKDSTPDITNNEYSSSTPSYTESVPQTTKKEENVAQSIEKEPYTSQSIVSETTEKAIIFNMPVEGEIIKEFSTKQLQFSETFGDMRLHTGTDIACKAGTRVSACADGEVKLLEKSSEYGNILTINHGNGIVIKYSALDKITLNIGDKVNAGDIIGVSTGIPSECIEKEHIHIEVFKNEKAVPLSEIIDTE